MNFFRSKKVKEIIGIVLIAFTALTFISLISFNPNDSSFNVVTTQKIKVRNYGGVIGAYLSDILIQLMGGGAFLIPLLTIALGVLMFFEWKEKAIISFIRLIGFILLSLSLCTLANLSGKADILFGKDVLSGGLMGDFTAKLLVGYFNTWGAYIIAFACLLLAVILTTHFSFTIFLIGMRNIFFGIAGGLRVRWIIYRERTKKAKERKKGELLKKDREKEGLPKIVDSKKIEKSSKPVEVQEHFNFLNNIRGFQLPPLSLLESSPLYEREKTDDELLMNARILEKKLMDFGIQGRVVNVHPGPVITMYEFEPAPGVKVSRIVNLCDDLSLAMSAYSVRIVAPIPGKAVVGVEIPNSDIELVYLKNILLADEFRAQKSKLAFALGKDIFGIPCASDLAKMPHLLIAGATGSGKSVLINSIICSLLFNVTPEEVKFLMIDPKMVELSVYDGIPHLITPVVTNPKKAAIALRNVVGIMEERYKLLAEYGLRNIDSYNKLVEKQKLPETENENLDFMPYLIVIIDELADLMVYASNEVEDSITRLAQMSRAVGIHLILATQRPSVNVITGVIKANLPARISFQVASKTDSRTILDANGAEQLLGKGDMLFLLPGTSKLKRIHGTYLSDIEVKRLVQFLKKQAQPEYDPSITQAKKETDEDDGSTGDYDEMYDEAVSLVTEKGQASISMIQRRLRVGYNRAARMVEMMEAEGIVSPSEGGKPRTVLARRNYD